MQIRLLIVSDIRLYREGLAQLLGRERELSVVGTAADLDDGIGSIRELRPDVVLLDRAMPGSIAFLRTARGLAPAPAIVALGVPEVDSEVLACAEAGVAGYVSREAGVPQLIATIQGVGRGELLCSPRIAAALLRRVTTLSSIQLPAAGRSRLTAREIEVLSLLERGCGNKDIARQLGIEVATVKNHVHNILEKLRVRRRGEAAAHLRLAGSHISGPVPARRQTI
jgi:DNA-binding NarL/FixJ family response regulator